MRLVSRSLSLRLLGISMVALAGAAASALLSERPAQAQLGNGNYSLCQPHQSEVVGWAYVNGDRTVEWWAYLDGEYQWADSSNVSPYPWRLDATYLGSGAWGSYSAWKTDVLERAEALGKTVIFQNHAVTEEVVGN